MRLNKNTELTLAGLVGLILVVAGPVCGAEEQPPGISYLQGEVNYRDAGETEWRAAGDTEVGLPAAGDLKVEKGEQVKLDLPDVGQIKVNESTVFSYKTTGADTLALNLFIGSVKCEIDELDTGGEVTVSTPHGVTGVRGTAFAAQAEQEEFSEIPVTEGEVYVEAADSRATVTAGEFLRVGESEGVLRRDSLKKRHKLIWQRWRRKRNHFFLRQKLRRLKFRKQQLERKSQVTEAEPGEKIIERIEALEAEISKLEAKLEELQSARQKTEQKYRALREKILEKRDNLMQKRLEDLENFRKQRLEKRKEFESDRQKRFEEFKRRFEDSEDR